MLNYARGRRRNTTGKGSHLDDSFLSKVRGYTKRTATTHDGMQLFKETTNSYHSLFPLDRDDSHFTIEHPEPELAGKLEEYFLDSYGSLFGRRGIEEVFNEIYFHLLVDGKVFYEINWEETPLGDETYTLPIGINYLATSTIFAPPRWLSFLGYIQFYTPITRLRKTYYTFKNSWFSHEEILAIQSSEPGGSAVQRSLAEVKKKVEYFHNSVLQQQSAAQPENRSLEVERMRYISSTAMKRDFDKAELKIAVMFRQLTQAVKFTEYYDIYSVYQYYRHLNAMRELIINAFNAQVLAVATQKNNGQDTPRLLLKEGAFLSNEQLDQIFKQYADGEIDTEMFVDLVIKRKNI